MNAASHVHRMQTLRLVVMGCTQSPTRRVHAIVRSARGRSRSATPKALRSRCLTPLGDGSRTGGARTLHVAGRLLGFPVTVRNGIIEEVLDDLLELLCRSARGCRWRDDSEDRVQNRVAPSEN